MVESIGNIGYQVGAVGIISFTVSFLLITRWWTDLLGRLVAGVLFTISAVLSMTVARMLNVQFPGGLFLWRAIVFWAFAFAVWTALCTFLWAQFLAPRIRKDTGRMTTRREHNSEQEVDLAGTRHSGDGDLHDHSGRSH